MFEINIGEYNFYSYLNIYLVYRILLFYCSLNRNARQYHPNLYNRKFQSWYQIHIRHLQKIGIYHFELKENKHRQMRLLQSHPYLKNLIY